MLAFGVVCATRLPTCEHIQHSFRSEGCCAHFERAIETILGDHGYPIHFFADDPQVVHRVQMQRMVPPYLATNRTREAENEAYKEEIGWNAYFNIKSSKRIFVDDDPYTTFFVQTFDSYRDAIDFEPKYQSIFYSPLFPIADLVSTNETVQAIFGVPDSLRDFKQKLEARGNWWGYETNEADVSRVMNLSASAIHFWTADPAALLDFYTTYKPYTEAQFDIFYANAGKMPGMNQFDLFPMAFPPDVATTAVEQMKTWTYSNFTWGEFRRVATPLMATVDAVPWMDHLQHTDVVMLDATAEGYRLTPVHRAIHKGYTTW